MKIKSVGDDMDKKQEREISQDTIQKNMKTLWLDKPLEDKNKDFFNMEISYQELKGAIEAGAGVIGIISDFGGGKSSLVRYLENEIDKKEYKVCNICLWSFYGSSNKDDMQNVSEMTHAFFYQMAKESVSPKFARRVNKMFNKNYGQLSIETSFRFKMALTVLMALFFCIVAAAGILPHVLPDLFGEEASLHALTEIILKNLSGLACIMLILALAWGKERIIFSNKESQGQRSLGIVDTYEIFDNIISETQKKKKYIICIEDLDRGESRKDVICFLKEIYKYNSLLSPKARGRFTFLILISQVLYDDIVDEGKQGENETRNNGRLHAKIFDYIMGIEPMRMDQREIIVKKLMHEPNISISLNGDEEKCAMKWICKGENIGIRDLKFRLNKAVSIEKALKALDEKVEFDKCALIAYLEEQYISDLYYLLHDQERFFKFMDEVIQKKNAADETVLENEIRECMKKYDYCGALTARTRRNPYAYGRQTQEKAKTLTSVFVEEWVDILLTTTITEDYKKYFFRNVKG